MALNQEQIAFYARWLSQMGVDKPLSETPTNFYTLSANAPQATIAQSAQKKDPQALLEKTAVRKAPPPKPLLGAPPVRPLRQSAAINIAKASRDAQEQAAEANDLAALKKAMEDFPHCALKETASHFVFADGNPEAAVMFIGEAPGAEEDRQGIPFVGQAGQLLDRMLAAIALSRETTYLTNLIPWRPPGARNPTPEERTMFRPFLDKHIALVKPRYIVLLGAIATKELLGTQEGISKLRGKWQSQALGGRTYEMLPTFHPAFLLRQPSQKKSSWEDLQSLQTKIKEGEHGKI